MTHKFKIDGCVPCSCRLDGTYENGTPFYLINTDMADPAFTPTGFLVRYYMMHGSNVSTIVPFHAYLDASGYAERVVQPFGKLDDFPNFNCRFFVVCDRYIPAIKEFKEAVAGMLI